MEGTSTRITTKAELEIDFTTGEELVVNQYALKEELGEGAYASVRRAVLVDDEKKQFAVKIMGKKKLRRARFAVGNLPLREQPNALQLAYKELELLGTITHEGVVDLVEAIDDESQDPMYFIIEFCDVGIVMTWNSQKHRFEVPKPVKDLKVVPFKSKFYGKSKKTYGKVQCQYILKDVASALSHLHDNGIVHFDLKPANILLTTLSDRVRCKLCDFGTGRNIETDEDGNEILFEFYIGTDEFTPPEVNASGEAFKGPPCDAWTLGTCLYGFAVGNLPFYDPEHKENVYELIASKTLEVPKSVDEKTKEIIERLLDKNPESRMTLAELVQSEYLSES